MPLISSCIPCRERKRKCDKQMPSCSNCSRVNRVCFYEHQMNDCQHRAPPEGSTPSLARNSSMATFESLTQVPLTSQLTLDDIFTNNGSLESFLSDQVNGFIGGSESQLATARRYFQTIHSWIQFIHRDCILEQFRNSPVCHDGDFSFLLLCMRLLITERPNNGSVPNKNPLYILIKATLPAIELQNTITVRNIQARLLICLYEIGHMIQPSLFLSISTTARCAITVGLNRKINPTESYDKNWISLEEEKRVWWTIYILDSYVPTLAGFCNFVTDDPSLNDCLPVEDNLWVSDAFPVPESLPLMTPASVCVGPLARTVQAAHLLRRTTIHIRRSTGNKAFNVTEAVQIHSVMSTLSDLLSHQATDPYCMNFCGAIGMCNSARILLYYYHQMDHSSHYESCNRYFGPVIDSCSAVINMAKRFNSIATMFDANALNPLLPFSIYQAGSALSMSFYWNHEGDKQLVFEELYTMLSFFGQRWKIAEYYLERLESKNTDVNLTKSVKS